MTGSTQSGEGRAVCVHCGFSALSGHGWLGPVSGIVGRRCPRCGEWVERRFNTGAHDPAHVRCACGGGWDEPIAWTRISYLTDPFLGLDLWLQAPFRDHVLWAYNGRHLAFMRDYVASPLRHREANRNSSVASRLPAWLKAASNRSAILAVIAKLEGTVDGAATR